MSTEFFALSFGVQLTLGSGYLAYVIAYAGLRQHHTTSDAVFKTIAFGIISGAIFTYGYQIKFTTAAVAFACTIAAGVAWRAFGMKLWAAILRDSKVSWADDIPTAWLSITATKTDASPNEVAVELADGRVLLCDDTYAFRHAHEGPVIFGLQGDIGLYVTSEMRADGSWIEKQDIFHEKGCLLTYVPASQIRRVELRYLSEKDAKAAGKLASEKEPAVLAEQNPGRRWVPEPLSRWPRRLIFRSGWSDDRAG